MSALLRCSETRGADFSLQDGSIRGKRPLLGLEPGVSPKDFPSWRVCFSILWQRREHINVLEAQSFLAAVKRSLRKSTGQHVRLLIFTDSQVVGHSVCRGRSSSRALNRVLRRIYAYCLAGSLQLTVAYYRSEHNPSDAPSRRFEPP